MQSTEKPTGVGVRSRAVDLSAINARFKAEVPRLRTEWERTARDLVDRRIRILNDEAAS